MSQVQAVRPEHDLTHIDDKGKPIAVYWVWEGDIPPKAIGEDEAIRLAQDLIALQEGSMDPAPVEIWRTGSQTTTPFPGPDGGLIKRWEAPKKMEASNTRALYRRCVETIARLHGKAPKALVEAVGSGSLVIARRMLDGYLERQDLPKTAASWKALEKWAEEGSKEEEEEESKEKAKRHALEEWDASPRTAMKFDLSSLSDEEVRKYHDLLGRVRNARTRIAIVKRCEKGDGEDGKEVCLYSHSGKLLGRHPNVESAKRQEAAIKAHEGRKKSAGVKSDLKNAIATYLNAVHQIMTGPDVKGSMPQETAQKLKRLDGELRGLYGEFDALHEQGKDMAQMKAEGHPLAKAFG